MIHIKRVDDFVNNKREIKENINKLDFEPIKWGVAAYDRDAEEDGGIAVSLPVYDGGGRMEAESYWKIYPIKKYADNWDVKAICVDAGDDMRYEVGDEFDLEIPQGPNTLYLQSDFEEAMDS